MRNPDVMKWCRFNQSGYNSSSRRQDPGYQAPNVPWTELIFLVVWNGFPISNKLYIFASPHTKLSLSMNVDHWDLHMYVSWQTSIQIKSFQLPKKKIWAETFVHLGGTFSCYIIVICILLGRGIVAYKTWALVTKLWCKKLRSRSTFDQI